MVVGDLLPLGSGTMQIIDLLKQQTPYHDQAMRSARQFVLDLLITHGIAEEQAADTTEGISSTGSTIAYCTTA